jgi:hypothetical protein
MWYKPELTSVEQLSQQRAIHNQIGELTVSLINHVFDPSVDKTFHKSFFDALLNLHKVWSYALAECPSDTWAESTDDKGKD